jgi:hypothetical protein
MKYDRKNSNYKQSSGDECVGLAGWRNGPNRLNYADGWHNWTAWA